MNQPYLINKGHTETIIYDNCKKKTHKMNWNSDYDGDKANIIMDINNNGDKSSYLFELNNEEIASLFEIPSINDPLDKRLINDLKKNKSSSWIEVTPENNFPQLISDKYTHISSPLQNEEFIIEDISIGKSKTKKKDLKLKKQKT
jgi:hypothetical protein